ncbi:MAG: RagB/SusD family nutrient uptake outer membrane protein [Bacteroidales bacterium]|jgi:tetratricopeptide (TPR) repeat protein|nr:RagB/SusD family nutrient uptake outer membrane protein [Bacteroidales bacterium]
MKKIQLLITLLGIALLSSCEGFLDVMPSNSAAAETSITNANDAKVVMNGLMRRLASSSYYGRDFILYGDAKGGDFAIYSQGRGYDGLYTFNHSVSVGNMGSYWSQMYDCILQANNLLLNINKIEAAGAGTTALSQIKGQALTTRALVYFDLVRLYGKPFNMDKASFGVPIVLEPLDASAQPTRSSVEAVYTQVLKDLTDGAPLLPKTKVNGFLNYYANKAIQARVYLHMDRYADALAASEEIITSNVYVPYTNTNWATSWATPFSSESIFELGIYAGEANLGTGSLGYYLLRRLRVTGALGWFMASDYFLNTLKQDPADIRYSMMERDESSTTRLGSCLKYVGGPALTGDKGTASATNIKVIRLSEVYLMAAEAALNLPSPDKTKAATYLNMIRKRAPNLAPATSTNITMAMIEDERSKELFAEGHRYFDMLRWNKTIEFNDDFIFPAVLITTREKTINRTFFKAILPIPESEINANPKIAEQQNPGYGN